MTFSTLKNLDATKLLEELPADLVLWNTNHEYLYVNRAAIQNDEVRQWIINKTDYDYCERFKKPLELAHSRRAWFNTCLESRSSVQFKEVLDSHNGKSYCIRAMSPIINADGSINYVIGYGFNETREVQSALELSKIKASLDTSKDGVAILDKNGVYTYMNKAHATIFEYEAPVELIGLTWETIYDDSEVEKIKRDYFPLLGANGFWSGSTRGKSKNGKDVFQDISLTGLPDGGLICITRDMTAMRSMLAETKRLALVAEKTRGMVMISDGQDYFQWANESFYEKTGYTPADFYGKKLHEMLFFLEQNEFPHDKIRESLKDRGEFQGKICIKLKNKNPFWILINLATVKNEEGIVVNHVLIQLDFNEYNEIQEQLYSSITKEKTLNQVKSRFLNVTSHEIKTPLTNIELYTEIIRAKGLVNAEGIAE
jgi:PAS domain S-box-containing protein